MTIPAATNVDDRPYLLSHVQANSTGCAGIGMAETREPYNSASHTPRSLQVTLTACHSADAGGQPVACEEVSA